MANEFHFQQQMISWRQLIHSKTTRCEYFRCPMLRLVSESKSMARGIGPIYSLEGSLLQ